jgi:hypothetical protein
VIGAIRDTWLALGERHTFDGIGRAQMFGQTAGDKIGYERSLYGYPTSDEFGPDAQHRRGDFEHGFIQWTPQTGARLHPPVVAFDEGTALNPVSG